MAVLTWNSPREGCGIGQLIEGLEAVSLAKGLGRGKEVPIAPE